MTEHLALADVAGGFIQIASGIGSFLEKRNWAAALQARDVRISPADVETTLQAFSDLWREAPGQPTTRAG